MRPVGPTPTTHILKPQRGYIPTAFGAIDLSNSVENEHYCLKLIKAFALPVASTQIAQFGKRTVLIVERFDRAWRGEPSTLAAGSLVPLRQTGPLAALDTIATCWDGGA